MDRRRRNVVALRAAIVALIAIAVTVPIIRVAGNSASADSIRASGRLSSTWTSGSRSSWPRTNRQGTRRFAGTRADSAPTSTAPDPAATDPAAPDAAEAPPTLSPPTTMAGAGTGNVGADTPATPPTTAATTPPTTSRPATTAPPATSPPPAGNGTWSLGQRPFIPSSSWNTPIPSGASYTNLGFPASTGNNYWVDWEAYSVGVWFSRPGDPLVAVQHPSGWGRPAGTINLHLPAGVSGAAGDDGSIVVVDGNTVYNMWQFVRTSNNSARCDAVGFTDVVNGTGWAQKSPPMGSGITSVGASQLAGLLVQSETDAGEIQHALELSVEETFVKPGQVGEAIHNDGQYPGGKLMEGQRLGIPRGASMPPGLSPLGQKVFRAFQTYGAYAVDASTGSTTLRAQSNAYNQSTIDALRKDMQKLGPMLQAVD